MDRFAIRPALLRAGRNLFRTIFGDLQWTPPAWQRRSANAVRRCSSLIEANPRASAGYLAAVLVIAVAATLGWRWMQSQPRPIEYAVSVTAPERTCIECDPPGRPQAVVMGFSGSVAPRISGQASDCKGRCFDRP